MGNDGAATTDLDTAISMDPTDPDLFHNRALIHRRTVRVLRCLGD
jgi:Tfp pilus assembly protein PilF